MSTDSDLRAKFDRALRDPFVRQLCARISQWQEEFGEREEEKERLDEMLNTAYKLAGTMVPDGSPDDWGAELVDRFETLRRQGKLPKAGVRS